MNNSKEFIRKAKDLHVSIDTLITLFNLWIDMTPEERMSVIKEMEGK